MSAGTIGNIESGARKNPRELLAIAKAVGVRAEWLRDGKEPVHPSESDDSWPNSKAALIPVAGYAQLGKNGWYEEVEALGSDGFVEGHSSDPDAYALRVRGDSMFPAIRDGWYVVVEPNGTPTSGEYVAISLREGQKMVKEFLFRNTNGVAVQSVNGGDRLTLSNDEILSVHAIGAVLMPSKHREA